MGAGVTAASMFTSFKFKAKANSKEQAGSMNDNFQKMLQGMGQVDNPGCSDVHRMLEKLNGEKFKNWPACLQYFKDNKDHPNLGEPKEVLQNYPFVRDFIDAMRTHAICYYNWSVFFNDCQLTMAGKNRGIGAAFNEAWEALGELRD